MQQKYHAEIYDSCNKNPLHKRILFVNFNYLIWPGHTRCLSLQFMILNCKENIVQDMAECRWLQGMVKLLLLDISRHQALVIGVAQFLLLFCSISWLTRNKYFIFVEITGQPKHSWTADVQVMQSILILSYHTRLSPPQYSLTVKLHFICI